MNKFTEKDILRKFSCGYYTLRQVEEVYKIPRKEVIRICSPTLDKVRWEIELASEIRQ